MLNVVPKGVTLTDEIDLIPVKANNAQLTIEQNKLVFKVSLRVAEKLNTTVASSRQVSLFWCDKYGDGAGCNKGGSTNVAQPVRGFKEDPNLSPITLNMGYYFMTYNFVVAIPGSASLSKFWFEIDDTASGGEKTEYTNGGPGYVYPEDSVFFVPMMSHVDLYADGSYTKTYTNRVGQNYTRVYELVVAARQDIKASRVYADASDVAVQDFAFPVQQTVEFTKNATLGSIDGYDLYTARFESAGVQLTMDVHADVGSGVDGDKTRTQVFAETTLLDNTVYVAPSNSSKGSDRLDGGAMRSRVTVGGLSTSMAWTFLAVFAFSYLS